MQRWIRYGSLVTFFIMVIVNSIAAVIGINGQTTGEVSKKVETLFAPANFTFSIWGIIYLLLFGFSIYQLFSRSLENERLNRISLLFLLSNIINIIWIYAWHYEKFGISLLLITLLWILLREIYIHTSAGECNVNKLDRLLIHIPFSMYFGWISIATIANFFATLKYYQVDFFLSESISTGIAIMLALVVGLIISIKKNDVYYLLVFLWAFIGILVKQWNGDMIVSLVAISAVLILIIQIISRIKEYLCI